MECAKSLLVACMFVGVVMSGSYSPGAPAQTAMIKPVAGDDLRSAYANPRMSRKANASRQFVRALSWRERYKRHQGHSHLAGQRPAYLYRDLRPISPGPAATKRWTAPSSF